MSDRRRDALISGISSFSGSAIAIGVVVGLGLPWGAYLIGALLAVLILAYRAWRAR